MNETTVRVIVLAHAASTLFLVGLIWFVQVVHYPLFAEVGKREFNRYEKKHSYRTSFVVGPPMLVEAGSALSLVFLRPDGLPSAVAWMGLALVIVIWLSTAAVQVPCHRLLEGGFDSAVHRRLVRSNWIRTVAWSLRGAIVLFSLWRMA